MRVFVAGASGAIGEPLIAELLQRGHSVIGIEAALGKREGVSSFVHIHDAAIATVALLAAPPGLYNLVDDDPSPQSAWLPAFAKFIGAPAPPRVSEAETAATAGEDAVYYATKLSGASNAKAKRILGWKPRRLEWLGA